MQTLENRFLRKITGAPFYFRNINLHLDLKMPTIQQFMKRLAKRFFDRSIKHPNPLISEAARYTPSRISKIRRPRHTLTIPDDATTLLQESSKATSTIRQHKHKPPSFRPRRRGPPRSPLLRPTRPLLEPARAAEPVALNSSLNNNVSDPACPLLPSPSDALSRGPYPTGGALSV